MRQQEIIRAISIGTLYACAGFVTGMTWIILVLSSVRGSTTAVGMILWYPLVCGAIATAMSMWLGRANVACTLLLSTGMCTALYVTSKSGALMCVGGEFIVCTAISGLCSFFGAFLRRAFVKPEFELGHCRNCGYSLYMLESRNCPECGAEITQP